MSEQKSRHSRYDIIEGFVGIFARRLLLTDVDYRANKATRPELHASLRNYMLASIAFANEVYGVTDDADLRTKQNNAVFTSGLAEVASDTGYNRRIYPSVFNAEHWDEGSADSMQRLRHADGTAVPTEPHDILRGIFAGRLWYDFCPPATVRQAEV